MTGDPADMVARLRVVLPTRWFSDGAPVLGALLAGLGAAWSALYDLLTTIRQQTRIATASGVFLDIASVDYFGPRLPRGAMESDAAYSARIRQTLIAPRATRAAMIGATMALTGRAVQIFEPRNATDTGGYGANTLGYGVCGGFGSLTLPYQFFVTVSRPNAAPFSGAGGYSVGPGGWNAEPLMYVDAAEIPGVVTDADIFATIAGVLPTNAVAWTRIAN
jgi:hypothetical protein